MKILLIALLLFASCFNAFGKVKPTSKEKAEKKAAVEILQKYANASNITVAIEKQDEKMALGTKTISEGTIKYSAGKIYLVLNSDKKTCSKCEVMNCSSCTNQGKCEKCQDGFYLDD